MYYFQAHGKGFDNISIVSTKKADCPTGFQIGLLPRLANDEIKEGIYLLFLLVNRICHFNKRRPKRSRIWW